MLCVVFASLGAAYYYKNVPRIYLATAILQVEQEVQRVVKIEQVVNEDLRGKEMLNTIAQKFCSRPLLERVVETNMLAKDPEFVVPLQGQIIDKEVLITKLEGMVQSSLRKDTRLVEVSVRHRNPKLAAKIANSLVEQYLNLDLDMLSASTKGAGAFLRDEADRLRR
ncbi:MAG: Wzz/FepE/Etk N-terminal domain-containing protein, partial [Chloroflexi bacterium]|nr:Wzz/FepE/Etk N-terminal domain-containing protein [Chloroflexota bacterium]